MLSVELKTYTVGVRGLGKATWRRRLLRDEQELAMKEHTEGLQAHGRARAQR